MNNKHKEQQDYEDIIHLPHPVSSRHPQMSMADRAAQFSPFAALTGYGDAVREKARFTEGKPELSEEEKRNLDDKLEQIYALCGQRPEVRLRYFVPDGKKDGGSFREITGVIRKADAVARKIRMQDGTEIDTDCVIDIQTDTARQQKEDREWG